MDWAEALADSLTLPKFSFQCALSLSCYIHATVANQGAVTMTSLVEVPKWIETSFLEPALLPQVVQV